MGTTFGTCDAMMAWYLFIPVSALKAQSRDEKDNSWGNWEHKNRIESLDWKFTVFQCTTQHVFRDYLMWYTDTLTAFVSFRISCIRIVMHVYVVKNVNDVENGTTSKVFHFTDLISNAQYNLRGK